MVALVRDPAVGADPFSHRQVQLLQHVPARRAALSGREEAVDLDQKAPVPRGLVAKLPGELAPTDIANRLG